MNIYQKLLELKKAVPYLKKADTAYGYNYVAEDDVLAVVNAKMSELGLLLVPSIDKNSLRDSRHEYVTTKGADAVDIIVMADMTYTWIDAETGEKLEVSWIMAGQQDDASQAVGSGITYCGRYFLLKFLQIATGKDDPDFWRSEQKKLIDKTAGKTPPKATPAPANTLPPEKPSEKPVDAWSDDEVRAYAYTISGGKTVTVGRVISDSPTVGGAAAWFDRIGHSTSRTPTEKAVAERAIAMLQPVPWDDPAPVVEG